MRTISFLSLFVLITISAAATDAANIKPVILGQHPVSTKQGTPVTLKLEDLLVLDLDDQYPQGFTLKPEPGNNYTLEGLTVTPNTNFVGTLKVGVKVNDGQDDSKKFDLKITVIKNSIPEITGQESITIMMGESFTLLIVSLIT